MARLLHVFPTFSLGGSQARLVALINAGFSSDEHLIVSLSGDLSALDMIEADTSVSGIDGRALMSGVLHWRGIRRWVLEHAPDRLLTYNWGAVDWAIAVLGTQIPHVAVEDGFGPDEAARRLHRRSMIRRAVFGFMKSRMVVPSRTLEEIARREWGIVSDRLSVIPNGVDPEKFKPEPPSKNGKPVPNASREWVIGTLAGLRHEKRLDRLIDAFVGVRAGLPARLMIGGNGDLELDLRQRCRQLGIEKFVEFHGFVKDTASFLKKLDVFVLSSDTEQLPISMIEAMLSGLPVIATDVGDVKKSLPDIQGAGVVERSSEAIEGALVSLLNSPDSISAWGLANRHHAIRHFSFQVMAASWQEIFDGVGSGKQDCSGKQTSSGEMSLVPRVIVYSSLFPSRVSPQAGIFIKERMFRVAKYMPLVVVSPQAWSPFDKLIRLFRPNFRPKGAKVEVIDGITVYRPRFFSLPAFFKGLDGRMMAIGSSRTLDRLKTEFNPTVLDAHFVYPDGYAASLLASRHGLPLTITLRGSKDEWLIGTSREPAMRKALSKASRIFAVSEALKRDVGIRLGQPESRMQVVRNGVDLERFFPVDGKTARQRFGFDSNHKVIVSAGWLVERKGFQRLIPVFADLHRSFPEARLLIVGTGTTQEDLGPSLRMLAQQCEVAAEVVFAGAIAPDEMRWAYSAGDVFALATAHEGWANVFLEAMACGLPVVTTDVGGNSQVVSGPELGVVVPFWEPESFRAALYDSLRKDWRKQPILDYANNHSWTHPVNLLVESLSVVSSSRLG